MRVEFLIEGSQGDEYSVTFEFAGSSARASCTCQAGTNGQFCKHRSALLNGDVARLRSINTADVSQLGLLMQNTDLGAAYAQVLSATKAHDDAKKALDAAKKRLARVAHQ